MPLLIIPLITFLKISHPSSTHLFGFQGTIEREMSFWCFPSVHTRPGQRDELRVVHSRSLLTSTSLKTHCLHQERCPSPPPKGDAKGKDGRPSRLEVGRFRILPEKRDEVHISLQLWLLSWPPSLLYLQSSECVDWWESENKNRVEVGGMKHCYY